MSLFVFICGIPFSISFEFFHLRLDRIIKNIMNWFHFYLFFLDHLLRLISSFVVDGCTSSFFNHSQKLLRFQVYDFCYLPLLYQKMRIFNIQMYTPKQTFHFGLGWWKSIHEKFCYFILIYLSSHQQSFTRLIPWWPHIFINTFKFDRDRSFFNTWAALFIDDLCKVWFETKHFFIGGT